MGMYTELNIGVNLRADTPKTIISILNYMLSHTPDNKIIEVTDHPLFETERWTMMLQCDSYYFDGHTDSSMQQDHISHEYELNVRSNLKNYDEEIELFLDFIQPYLTTYGFLGYMRYEEWDDPMLIYHENDKIVLWSPVRCERDNRRIEI